MEQQWQAATRTIGPLAAVVLVLGLGLGAAVACGEEGSSAGPLSPGGNGGGGGGEPDSGTLVSGDGYEGVLLDAGLDWLQPADGPAIEDVDSFVPTEDDVARFEAELADAIPADANPGADPVVPEDLDGYVRQYTGVASEVGDDRHLVVAGICETAAGNTMDDWRTGWIEVADGGTCFWDATMDLVDGAILRFSFHGSA